MTGKIPASRLFASALAGFVSFTAMSALAHEAEEPRARNETCLAVSLDGDYKIKIPCPPGTRSLLEQLPQPAEPAPRRDIVIDPEWPRDQAMAVEHDWPHDSAMIVPHAEEGEDTVPLFDELLGVIERDVRASKVRKLLQDWFPRKSK